MPNGTSKAWRPALSELKSASHLVNASSLHSPFLACTCMYTCIFPSLTSPPPSQGQRTTCRRLKGGAHGKMMPLESLLSGSKVGVGGLVPGAEEKATEGLVSLYHGPLVIPHLIPISSVYSDAPRIQLER